MHSESFIITFVRNISLLYIMLHTKVVCITYLHANLVNFCRSLVSFIHACIVCQSDQFLPEIGS